MTLTSFVDLVKAWTDAQGQAFLTEYGDIADLINRESKRFAAETLCLYSDSITFTLTASTSKYSMRDTAVFSKQIIEPVHVWVNDHLKTRLASVAEMALLDPNFHTASDAEPIYWYTQPPNHIILRSPPASAYSNSKVEGWYLPDDMTYPGEYDTNPTLEFPDDVIDPLALHCAIALMFPRATGDLLERVGMLKQANAADKATIRAAADRLMQPAPVRRQSRKTYTLG